MECSATNSVTLRRAQAPIHQRWSDSIAAERLRHGEQTSRQYCGHRGKTVSPRERRLIPVLNLRKMFQITPLIVAAASFLHSDPDVTVSVL